MTTPPLEPEVPHFDVPAALKKIFEPYVKVQLSKLITASVFVIKNIGADPYTLLSSSIVIVDSLQVKVLVPESASPDID